MKPFTDNSIVQGWMQYFDEEGTEWRRQETDIGFEFYKDVGNAFLYVGRYVPTRNYKNLKDIETIHYIWLDEIQELEDEDDEE